MLDSRAWTRGRGDRGGEISEHRLFGLLQEDIDKINKFFLGKLASLRVDLEAMTAKPNRGYAHHAESHVDLLRLRDIYVELAACALQ